MGQRVAGDAVHSLAGQGGAVGAVPEEAQQRKLRAHRLAAPRRRRHQHVVVAVVQGAEHLRLDGVEVLEAVPKQHLLRARLAQRAHRQRLQVQQLHRRRVFLRQQQVAEGDRQLGLGAQPAVGDEADEVHGGQGILERHREGQVRVLRRELDLEQEVLRVQDGLLVAVLDEDPPGLHGAVAFVVPLEVGGHGEVHPQHAAGDGLHAGGQLEAGELVDELVEGLAHFGHPDQLPDLLAAQVPPPLPRQVLALHLEHDVQGHPLELAQRRLGRPQPALGHLAEGEGLLRHPRPTPAQRNLEQAAQQAARRLGDVHHVCRQGEAVQLEARDVGLQQDVDLGRRLVQGLLDGDGHPLQQAGQLHLLLLPHRHVLELLRHGKQAAELNLPVVGLHVAVERRHGAVGHVVVARDAPQVGDGQRAAAAVVAEEASLVELQGGGVHQVRPPPLQPGVRLHRVRPDAVQHRVAEHAHK